MSPREHSVFLCVPEMRAADATGHGPAPGSRPSAGNHAPLPKSVGGMAAAPALDPTADLTATQLRREIRLRLPNIAIHSCASLPELHAALCRIAPDSIVLDQSLLSGGTVEDTLAALAQSAPLVLIGSDAGTTDGSAHADLIGSDGVRSRLASLIAASRADFVFRCGNFSALAAALVERAVRAAEAVQAELESGLRDLSDGDLEVLRHEINNPLTGILGNAEILLASPRLQLPPDSVQRLQTIVELAVRLRENVVRVSRELPLARRPASR